MRPPARAGSLLFLAQAGLAAAAFSVGGKRFKNEGLLKAGSLGLSDGKVAAWGDADNDQFTDAFVISDHETQVSIRLWDHSSFEFRQPGAQQIINITSGSRIRNVVPADFNQDGLLDVLIMSTPSSSKSPVGELELSLHLGLGGGRFDPSPQTLPSASSIQPLLLDGTGNLAMDLLGHATDGDSHLRLWKNNFNAAANDTQSPFTLEDVSLIDVNGSPIKSSCQLTEPHSSAFIDLDGDCTADLFLTCQGRSMAAPRYEIWTALRGTEGEKQWDATFQLSQRGDLPTGTGMLSFADLDRDGTIDVVFPTCDGKDCFINVAKNEQMPLCSTEPADWTLPWFTQQPPNAAPADHLANMSRAEMMLPRAATKCREPSKLCTSDPDFKFNFDSHLRRYNVKDVIGSDWDLLMSDNSVMPAQPISIAVGDFNKDGYPDLLVVATNEGAGKSQAFLLQNTKCSKAPSGAPGCDADSDARTFVKAPGSEALGVVADVVRASFVDLDEDGTLDIMLQTLVRSGGTSKHEIVFIQNNLFYDSFFLKLQMLNGACERECPGGFRPWGANYAGASYKFTVLDPNGIRRAQQVGQLAQATYGSLLTPISYLGLGRTNNYVELLEAGSSRRQAQNVLSMEGVIPNSQIYINPWQPQGDTQKGRGSPSTWSKEMFLHPGDWIPWVTVVLVAITVMLAGIVVLLHLHERREDEKERKRAVYAINFDAL